MTAAPARWRLHATGRVQGVGYRRFVERTARSLGLGGFVRNETDGTVLAEAEGPPEALSGLRAAMARGPLLARVDAVAVVELAPVGEVVFRVAR